MNRKTATLLSLAADLVRQDTSRLPRGTMENVRAALENGQDGHSRSGRIKYRKGTVANILDALAGNDFTDSDRDDEED